MPAKALIWRFLMKASASTIKTDKEGYRANETAIQEKKLQSVDHLYCAMIQNLFPFKFPLVFNWITCTNFFALLSGSSLQSS